MNLRLFGKCINIYKIQIQIKQLVPRWFLVTSFATHRHTWSKTNRSSLLKMLIAIISRPQDQQNRSISIFCIIPNNSQRNCRFFYLNHCSSIFYVKRFPQLDLHYIENIGNENLQFSTFVNGENKCMGNVLLGKIILSCLRHHHITIDTKTHTHYIYMWILLQYFIC